MVWWNSSNEFGSIWRVRLKNSSTVSSAVTAMLCLHSEHKKTVKPEVIFVCFDVVHRLECQLTPDGRSRPHKRWREVIRHCFGIIPPNVSPWWGLQERGWRGRVWRREEDSRGFMFGPLLWIMQPSVRSAHCPPLDFLVSSVTITRLRFTPALTPSLPHRSPPPPLPPAPTLHSSEKHRWGKNNTSELSFLLLDKSRRVFSSTAGSPQNFITVVTITVTTKIIFIIIFYYLPPPSPNFN